MIQFRSKSQLLSWLDSNAPRPCIKRAMEDGQIELLGAFDPAPGSKCPGWIVRVVTQFQTVWNVVVTYNKERKLRCYTVDKIYWCDYKGGNSSLYSGDYPERYKELKNA